MKISFKPVQALPLIFNLFTVANLFCQDTLSVLFLGNSYTAVNNVPQLVTSLANSAGKTLIVDANTPGGYTISGHLSNAASVDKIKQRTWDYIVIQEQSQLPSIEYYRFNDFYPALTELKDTIEFYNPCARIITYMTWGRRFGGMQCDPSNTHCSPKFVDFNHMQDTLTSAYLEISRKLKVQCAPVGVVWQNILNDTNVVLHSGDNSHPNLDGSYVAACAIYSCIWKSGVVGLSYTAGLSNPLAQYYQSASDKTIFNNVNDWNLYINKPKANFGTSISGYIATFTNLSNSISKALKYHWDFGDGKISSQPSPSHTYSSNGNYTVKLISSDCEFSDTFEQKIQIGNSNVAGNLKSDLLFYPNPTSSQLFLEVENQSLGSLLRVYDMKGELKLSSRILSPQTSVDLGHFANGLYLFQLGENGGRSFKVMKE